jgi:tRNA G18 (ribose-2'-O)-methylase SpoU
MSKTTDVVVVLHNIRSEYNVGSIFRSADAMGVDKIYLTGYTPAPLDRFGRTVKEIAKVALGAEKSVSWEKEKSISKLIKALKQKSYQVIAIEQSSESQGYKKVMPKFPCAFIFGNEVKGLNESVLKAVDIIAEIPMRGNKESLNVSVAFGVALFRILDI